MASSRQPGPECQWTLPQQIDDGTTARAASRAPGTVGAGRVMLYQTVLPPDDFERALDAAWRSLRKIPREMRARVTAMLTPGALAVLLGTTAIWAGSQFVPVVGEAVDLLIVTVGVITVGRDSIDVARNFAGFWQSVHGATTDKDLDHAADLFAAAISLVGIDGLMVLVALGTRSKAAGTAGAAATAEVALARWSRFIESMDLATPPGKGVLWSKLGPSNFGAYRAGLFAQQSGRVTLEMLLDRYGFFELYEAEFGSAKNDVTGQIWQMVSRKYANGLSGVVTGYIDNTKLLRGIQTSAVRPEAPLRLMSSESIEPLQSKLPQITAELDEISDIMTRNKRISSVMLYDNRGGEPVVMTRDAVMKTAGRSH
jgi:hypothetical protein